MKSGKSSEPNLHFWVEQNVNFREFCVGFSSTEAQPEFSTGGLQGVAWRRRTWFPVGPFFHLVGWFQMVFRLPQKSKFGIMISLLNTKVSKFWENDDRGETEKNDISATSRNHQQNLDRFFLVVLWNILCFYPDPWVNDEIWLYDIFQMDRFNHQLGLAISMSSLCDYLWGLPMWITLTFTQDNARMQSWHVKGFPVRIPSFPHANPIISG